MTMTLLHASEDCTRKNAHSGVLVAIVSVVDERNISRHIWRNNIANEKAMYSEKNNPISALSAINPTKTALESNVVLHR